MSADIGEPEWRVAAAQSGNMMHAHADHAGASLWESRALPIYLAARAALRDADSWREECLEGGATPDWRVAPAFHAATRAARGLNARRTLVYRDGAVGPSLLMRLVATVVVLPTTSVPQPEEFGAALAETLLGGTPVEQLLPWLQQGVRDAAVLAHLRAGAPLPWALAAAGAR